MEGIKELHLYIPLLLLLTPLCHCALINGRFPYYIVEELPSLTPIGNIAVDAKLNVKYAPAVYTALTFRFLSPGIPALFTINATTSIIRTAVKIDRDAVCASEVTCHVPLDVVVGPDEHYEVIRIVVDILDINDHSPTFASESINLKVSEATSYGTILEVPMATDIDSRPFSITSYEIAPETGLFKLHVNKDREGKIVNLRIQITANLDHEVADVYQIKLVARDGGDPSRMGYMLINLQVLDANDNIPEFNSRKYEVFVSESVDVDTVIAKVTATDEDDGIFGRISYRFSPTTYRLFPSLFDLNSITGQIFIRDVIDYEINPTYQLEVLASDEGSPDIVSTATVLVRVIDTNDWVPAITIDTQHGDGNARVPENTIPGQTVAYLAVSDNDAGKNGETGCVLDNAFFAVAKVDRGTFKVVTSDTTVDREVNHTVDLEIVCFDYGDPPNEVTQQMQVVIEDVNDNAPEFSQPQYEAEISENNRVGAQITTVTATDRDDGHNADVRYTLQDKYTTLFAINSMSGVITSKLSLDREQVETLRFSVYAVDLGSPSLTTSALVVVSVKDINDSPPIFEEPTYAFGVYENEAEGTVVGSVVAHDRDTRPGNVFHYELSSQNQSQAPFTVNRSSGEITTTMLLDREHTPAYYFTALAVNQHYPPMTASASVTVYVADRNDHGPVILWPTYKDNTVSVPINAHKGTIISKIIAKDNDLGDNSKLHYSVQESDFSGYFSVQVTSGVISVYKHLQEITDREYINLIIVVSDSGQTVKKSFTSLDIYLNTSVEYYPTTDSSYNMTGSRNIMYVDNNTAIIASLTSLGLLLIFVIILALLLIRRIADKDQLICHKSEHVYKSNQVNEAIDRCYRLREEQC